VAEDGRPSERGHWPVKSAPKSWNVRKLWWELTKIVLRRGGYEIGVILVGAPAEVSKVLDRHQWEFTYLDWVGGEDRFAVLHAEVPDER
jgi:hypothetical protein